MEAYAATDATRSIIANPLQMLAARQKDSFNLQKIAIAITNLLKTCPLHRSLLCESSRKQCRCLDGRLVSASAADVRPLERVCDEARRFAVYDVYENAVERLNICFS